MTTPEPESTPDATNGIETFGRFELHECLSAGSAASLFKATDTKTGKLVLLRRLTLAQSNNPQIARSHDDLADGPLLRLDDPQIMRLLDAGEAAGCRFLAFEHFDGKSLAEVMQGGRLPLAEAIEIVRQVGLGLRAVHEKRIVHGDVKPANVLVGRDSHNRPQVKLAIADLATLAADAMVSVFGEVVGAPKYMSPEQIQGRAVSKRSDIFSLGVLAYELIGGREPHDVKNVLGYLRANCDCDAVPLAQIDTSIPSGVSRVVQRMIARDPVRRYRNCQNLLDDLDRLDARIAGDYSEIVQPGVDSAFAPRHPVDQLRDRGSRLWPGVAIAASAVAFFFLGILVAGIWLREQPSDDATTSRDREVVSSRRADRRPDESEINRRGRYPRGERGRGESASETDRRTEDRAKTGRRDASRAESGRRPSIPTPKPRRPTRASAADKALEQAVSGAKKAIKQGNFGVAIHYFEKLADKYTERTIAARIRDRMAWVACEEAFSLEKKREFTPAADAYTAVMQTYPQSSQVPIANKGAMRCLQSSYAQSWRNKDWRQAVATMRKLIERFPNQPAARKGRDDLPRVLYEWADDNLTQNVPEKALTRLREIVNVHQDTIWAKKAHGQLPGALLLAGEKHLAAGRFEDAAKTFAELFRKYPDDVRAERAREQDAKLAAQSAAKLLAKGEVEAALAKWRDLAQRYPASRHLKAPGDMTMLHKLVQDLSTPASVKPTPPQIMDAWAYRLEKLGRGEEANALREKLAQKYSASPQAKKQSARAAHGLYDQAIAALESARPDDAIAILKRLIDENPKGTLRVKTRQLTNHIKATPADMVYVPAGVFVMGLSRADVAKLGNDFDIPPMYHKWFNNQVPSREVDLPAFYMDKYEVTNAQYKRFIDATKRPPPQGPAWSGGNVRPGFENHPVTHVTWYDAEAYAKWTGKRLPTEAEWEKAARGPDRRRFPWGNNFDRTYAWVGPGKRSTAPVGTHPKGVSPYGCHDMAGNVQEWTADIYRPYPGAPAHGSSTSAGAKVFRGGSCAEKSPYDVTCTVRATAGPHRKGVVIGFRCARSP